MTDSPLSRAAWHVLVAFRLARADGAREEGDFEEEARALRRALSQTVGRLKDVEGRLRGYQEHTDLFWGLYDDALSILREDLESEIRDHRIEAARMLRRHGGHDRDRRRLPRKKRWAILVRDEFKCVYCGRGPKDGVTLHVDHIEAWAGGGPTVPGNLVTACEDCNLGKSDFPLPSDVAEGVRPESGP